MTYNYFEILLNSKYAIFGVISIFISALAHAIRVIWRVIKENKVINLVNDNRDVSIGKQGEIIVTNLNQGNKKKSSVKNSKEKTNRQIN